MLFRDSAPFHPFGTFFVQEQQNTVKRGTRSTSEILHDETKTMKIRSERRLDNARCHGRVRTAAKVVPRVSREPPGRLLDVSGTVLEPPAGSQNGSEAAFSRSGAVLEYFGPLPNGPGSFQTAPTRVFVDLSSNFRRICIVLGTFWSDFLAIWCDVLLDCLSAFL